MSNVGTLVVLATLLLWAPPSPLTLLLIYLLVSLPFDLLGGQILPRRYGRPTPSWKRWIRVYLRSLSVHTGVLLVSGYLLSLAGPLGLVLPTAAALMVFWLALQSPLAIAGGALQLYEQPSFEGRRVALAECAEDGFTGGVCGLPGQETLILPAHWPDEVLATLRVRRKAVVGTRARDLGLVAAVSWNLLGLCWASSGLVFVGTDLTMLALRMTLWTFFGLLTLPTLARKGAFWADHLTVRREGWPRFQRYLDYLEDETAEAHPPVESVFYPVPGRASRLGRLERKRAAGLGPWNVARASLTLSCVNLGLLSRAVHCNAGRPALWFFPPCD